MNTLTCKHYSSQKFFISLPALLGLTSAHGPIWPSKSLLYVLHISNYSLLQKKNYKKGMEWKERVFIHYLVKSSRHARSSSTLILANSAGGGAQHHPFLIVLVLEHRLAMLCCLHNSPRHLGFPPKEAWAHRQRGNSDALPQVPWQGWWGNWFCELDHRTFPSASRMQLVQHGQGSGGAAPDNCRLCLWLSVGHIGLHQLRTPAELVS